MQKMSLKKLNEIRDGTERALLFMKGDDCHLCHQFEPIISSLEEDYKNDIKFFVCSNEYLEISEELEEQINGVPTVVLFGGGSYFVVPDPAVPDRASWYTREYIDQFLKEW